MECLARGHPRSQGSPVVSPDRSVVDCAFEFVDSMKDAPTKSIVEIAAGTAYPPEAFVFIREGLHAAAVDVHGPEPEMANPALVGKRHVSGQQLCHGLRDVAILRWGLMAKTVLNSWNVRETLDFGKIVYAMIDNELMQKTEGDSLEDFRDVFDFNQAFSTENCLRMNLPK